MSDRIKLVVTEAKEPQEVGSKGAKKLTFKAKSPDGANLTYFTFKTSLFEVIKVNAELDAEVEVKSREVEGNTYVDRQVQQLYVEGKPVGSVPGATGRQGGYTRHDSPEERASIESQTAAKIAGELLVGKIITPVDALGKALIAWCAARLTKETAPEAPKTGMKPPAPSQSTDQVDTSPKIAEPLQEVLDNIVKSVPPQKPNWPLIAKYCKALGFPAAHLPKVLGLPGDDVNQWKGSHEEALDKAEAYARKNCQYVGPAWRVIKLV